MNNKIVKLSVILFLVCAITAGVLGVVNELTYKRIEAINTEKTTAAYRTVLPDADSFSEVDISAIKQTHPTVYYLCKANNGAGYVVESSFTGAQGAIVMAVGVGADFKCTGIAIIAHSETSGLGANAASTAQVGVDFRAQFVGQGEDVALAKAGGEIDALSGATITSRSVTNAVAESIKAVKEVA